MIATTINPLSRVLALIGWRVGLELVRRKDFYVLLMLMALFIGGVLVFRVAGIDAPATGTMLMNLGLTLAWFAAHLMTLLLAARQLPAEIEQRTIYPLLARPLSRGAALAGYWMSCALCGAVCWLVLLALVWLGAPKLEPYDGALLAQMIALQIFSLGMMAALALAGSLLMPKPVNLIVTALVWLGGGKLASLVTARFAAEEAAGAGLAGWLMAYIPDFSKLNLITRYTDGIGPVGGLEFLGLAAYAGIFTLAALALAGWVFGRKAL